MVDIIAFTKGYKYQLEEDYRAKIPWVRDTNGHSTGPFIDYESEFLHFYVVDRTLLIRCGYAWDGPSGPTIDTPDFMRGSLVHDALYQLIRKGYFREIKKYRKMADSFLYKICRDEGMSLIRAFYVWIAVRLFGDHSAEPGDDKKIIYC